MSKKINLKRYKELLKWNPSSSFDETVFELWRYQGTIISQISYNRKDKYFSLINNYLSGIITPYDFRLKFLEMEREDSKEIHKINENFEALEMFTLADDLENFSDLMIEIWTLCSDYDEIFDDEVGRGMTEAQFYSKINQVFKQF